VVVIAPYLLFRPVRGCEYPLFQWLRVGISVTRGIRGSARKAHAQPLGFEERPRSHASLFP
jgi:hypothetical protein